MGLLDSIGGQLLNSLQSQQGAQGGRNVAIGPRLEIGRALQFSSGHFPVLELVLPSYIRAWLRLSFGSAGCFQICTQPVRQRPHSTAV